MLRYGALLFLLAVLSCAKPPPEAYLGSAGQNGGAGLGLGRNAAGESCSQQAAGNRTDIFCGSWDQPSGTVTVLTSPDVNAVATSSPWRNGLDSRFDCSAPTSTTILGGAPAVLMQCTRRVGGWPQVALVAAVDGRTYAATGILPAATVLQRSIAVLSGRSTAQGAPDLPPGQVASLLAARLAAQSFSASDIGQFQQLMTAGTRANLAGDFGAAEKAYRAAYALERKALGANNPNTALPLMLIALQMSDAGRIGEADVAFAQAGRLVTGTPDAMLRARLGHYQGLSALNAGEPARALPLLEDAEARYAAMLPADLLAAGPTRVRGAIVVSRSSAGGEAGGPLLLEPDQQAGLVGVVETRRYQAIALRELNRLDDAAAKLRSAQELAAARGLSQRDLTARLGRTRSLVLEASLPGSGGGLMQRAYLDFSASQPGTRPVAETLLLQAGQFGSADPAAAVAACRSAVTLLREIKAGTAAPLLSPCLAAFATQAEQQPSQRQALLAEMFAAAQLAQGSITARQIALASARVAENSRDPRVGAAIRRQQDASLAVAELQQQADAAAQSDRRAGSAEVLGARLVKARAELADADAALQAASPNYGQLVQEVVSAADVLAALGPGEAFALLTLGVNQGWVFVLRDGTVTVARLPQGTAGVAALVKRVRASVEPGDNGEPPPFDIAAAQALYADTLGPAAAALEGAQALTVVPVGALLSLPFELLLTGPASPDRLAAAPWLMQRFAITHVPAAANFVSLRREAAGAAPPQPWFGFGDFRPVTLTQARQNFPAETCRDSARLFADLPPLPFAMRELTAARLLMGGSVEHELLGFSFNAPAVVKTDLRGYRVLHFATHALLPTDLSCQAEPAIVTSDVPGAADATGALLTATQITAMQLDADVVILSACNSGGPNGGSVGESLSGLARAFFYAGARAMLVSHWSINDQATALLVAGTLQRLRAGSPLGLAGAFQGAERAILADAGTKLPAAIAHPFYWAPFALVGEGRGRTVSAGAGGIAGL